MSADEYPRAKETINRPELKEKSHTPGRRWWRMDKLPPVDGKPNPNVPLAAEIFGVKDKVAENQLTRSRDCDLFTLMYDGMDVEAFLSAVGVPLMVGGASAGASNFGPMLNVSKSVVDTVAARVSSDKPKMAFLTEGGNWNQQQKAKKLEKLLSGLFYEWDIYHYAPHLALDALIWGDGAFKLYEEEKRVCIERTMVPEILVDDGDGRYGDPRQMIHRRYMAQDQLAALFPEFEDQIFQAQLVTAEVTQSRSVVDACEVVEIWHRRPAKDGKSHGRHVICIENCVLEDDNEWDDDWFPYAFLEYDHRQVGFWGKGIIESGRSIQADINRTERRTSEILRRCTVPRVYLERGSRIIKSQIGSVIGQMIEYTGRPPSFEAPNRVPPELFSRTATKKGEYYEMAGVNQMNVQGEAPKNLDSAKAIETYDDVGSMRFQVFANNYQHLFMDLGKQALKLIRKIVERDGTYPINVPARGFMEVVDAKDILDITDDEFIMKMWPVNLLPDSPSGKFQSLNDLGKNGWLPQEALVDLFDFPDVQAALGPVNAPLELVKWQADQMFDKGKPVQPEFDVQDPSFCQGHINLFIQQAQVQGCPEDNLTLARTYAQICGAEVQKRAAAAQAAAAAAAPPPQMAAPLGRPAPQPVGGGLPVAAQ